MRDAPTGFLVAGRDDLFAPPVDYGGATCPTRPERHNCRSNPENPNWLRDVLEVLRVKIEGPISQRLLHDLGGNADASWLGHPVEPSCDVDAVALDHHSAESNVGAEVEAPLHSIALRA